MTLHSQANEIHSAVLLIALTILVTCVLPFGCASRESGTLPAATLNTESEARRNVERLIGVKLPASVANCRYFSQDVGGWGGGMEFAYFELSESDASALLDESPRLPDTGELRSDPTVWDVEGITDKDGKVIPWWQPRDLQQKRFASRRHSELVWGMYVCIGTIEAGRTGVYIFYRCD